MPTVLFSAPYMIPIIDRFLPIFKRFEVELIIAQVRERLDEAELLSYAGKYDGTICGDDRYTAEVLEACAPRLKVISKWGTGIDSIDQKTAARLGIQVCRTPGAFTFAVADSAVGYMLAFARQLPFMDRAMKNGIWGKVPGRSLGECTLGVVGVGTIGKAVIHRARAFGMQLLGTDIVEISPEFCAEYGLTMTSPENLLQRSDFVSLHCDLNPTSYQLINHNTLGMMKPSAFLINTARGPVVLERDLIEALQKGEIAGAALDVYENEPLPKDSPLLRMDNVLLAPHNANSSPAAWKRVHANTIRNLLIGLGFNPREEDFGQEI
jgi:D-3-phosphoglycerate dehydrogenase / 2-oxoglutarate reductase